ncbi:hypothetical protein NKJ06_32235 [Mesorhizobium sp. M0293]|uniref:hypothetical protein n=1 Tax=Mesorhizobium sp. M0293 TaxID=2956930 RepID=UPI00333BC9EA
MLKRVWDGTVSLWVTIAICSFLLFVTALGFMSARAYDRATKDYQTSRAYDETRRQFEQRCAGFEGKEIFNCLKEQIETAREPSRAEEDVGAQKEMARWALWMLIITGVLGLASVLVGLVGIFLIRDTLATNKEATDAAKAAVAHASQTAKLELRAYLTVEPAGVDQLIGRAEVIGKVRLRNVGRLPARKVTLVVRMARSKGVEMIASRRRSKFSFSHPPIYSDRVVQPDGEMRQGSEDYLAIADLCLPHHNVYVYGIALYENGYGTPCFTRFCHRYSTDGRVQGINWKTLTTKSRTFIDTDKARYHAHGNSAEEPEATG